MFFQAKGSSVANLADYVLRMYIYIIRILYIYICNTVGQPPYISDLSSILYYRK